MCKKLTMKQIKFMKVLPMDYKNLFNNNPHFPNMIHIKNIVHDKRIIALFLSVLIISIVTILSMNSNTRNFIEQ